MNEKDRLLLKIISIALQYPDEEHLQLMESVGEMIHELPDATHRDILLGFLSHLGKTPPIRLQEEYTRIFDLNPHTSLNLTYHRWADKKERGEALAYLKHVYETAGYEFVGRDLPDCLPVLLEFLSICPQESYSWIVTEYKGEVSALAERFQGLQSQYGCLFEILRETFSG